MWESHAAMVKALAKPSDEVVARLDGQRADLWHAVTGVVTEAGELMDAVKKLVIYNKSLDRENLVEELGDIEFYMEQVRQNAGIDRADVIAANMAKLARRYGSTYSDVAAQARADKQ